jgi:hypothetical protein
MLGVCWGNHPRDSRERACSQDVPVYGLHTIIFKNLNMRPASKQVSTATRHVSKAFDPSVAPPSVRASSEI